MSSKVSLEPDTMWGGRLILWQPARRGGYRFNLDPILLAGFAAEWPGPLGHVLDLGAGCGIVGLMLLASGRASRVTSVERQPELAQHLRRNIEQNGFGPHATLIEGDLRHTKLPVADVVVFNPPYFKVGHGLASANPGRDAGRREVHGTLDDFVSQAARSVSPTGRVVAIMPVARVKQFLVQAQACALVLQRRQDVHAFADGPAKHCLLQVGPKQPGCAGVESQHSTLVVHQDMGGGYSPGVARLIAGIMPSGGPEPSR